jgi:hypothetical protein
MVSSPSELEDAKGPFSSFTESFMLGIDSGTSPTAMTDHLNNGKWKPNSSLFFSVVVPIQCFSDFNMS